MKTRIFDPAGISPEDYRFTYSELQSIPEFQNLSGSALIFVWYYANPTSHLIKVEKKKRAEEALRLSGYNPDEKLKNNIIDGRFPDLLAKAIDRMSRFRPDERERAYNMIKNIMDQYEVIANKPVDDFKDKDGEISHDKYVRTTSKIAEELPKLISLLEEGFGVKQETGEKEEEETENFLRQLYKSRE